MLADDGTQFESLKFHFLSSPRTVTCASIHYILYSNHVRRKLSTLLYTIPIWCPLLPSGEPIIFDDFGADFFLHRPARRERWTRLEGLERSESRLPYSQMECSWLGEGMKGRERIDEIAEFDSVKPPSSRVIEVRELASTARTS